MWNTGKWWKLHETWIFSISYNLQSHVTSMPHSAYMMDNMEFYCNCIRNCGTMKYFLYSMQNIVRVTKFLRMRWVLYIIHMGEKETFITFHWENLKRRDCLEQVGLDGRIIVQWIFENWILRICADLNLLKGPLVGFCEGTEVNLYSRQLLTSWITFNMPRKALFHRIHEPPSSADTWIRANKSVWDMK